MNSIRSANQEPLNDAVLAADLLDSANTLLNTSSLRVERCAAALLSYAGCRVLLQRANLSDFDTERGYKAPFDRLRAAIPYPEQEIDMILTVGQGVDRRSHPDRELMPRDETQILDRDEIGAVSISTARQTRGFLQIASPYTARATATLLTDLLDNAFLNRRPFEASEVRLNSNKTTRKP